MSTQKTEPLTNRTALVILGIALAIILLFCFSNGISGNDFWWHIKVGEFIVEEHSVPTSDIFSWYGQSKAISWTPHEWLSDVFFYFLFATSGEIGIYIFSICCAALMIFLLVWQCRKAIAHNFLVGGLFFSLFAVLTRLFFYGRPHIFSFFFLFIELKILYGFLENEDSKAIFALPLIAALWSNLHGGSSNLSYILCVAFFAVGLLNIHIGKIEAHHLTKRGAIRLTIVSLLCVLGIFLNPIGKDVFIYPYVSFGDTLNMAVISEWHAPDAKILGNLILYFVPIGIITFCMFSSERKYKMIDMAVMCIFLLLFFRSVRFIIMWYISAAFYSVDYWPECRVKEIKGVLEKAAIVILFIIFLIPIGTSVKNLLNTVKSNNIISRTLSDDAINFVITEDPQRLFNDYNVGEALIYNGISVFFDARADLYSAEHIMEDGVSLLFLEQANANSEAKNVDIESLIDYYGFDGMILLKSRPLYAYLQSHPTKYRLLFEDESVGYFKVED